MQRKDFLKTIGIAAVAGTTMKLSALNRVLEEGEKTETMPVMFIGHGSPMNAIEENTFTKGMKSAIAGVSKPKAILMVSAHWETKGTFVTNQELPPTIHDFGGFPKALFDVKYPAPGSSWLADETKSTIKKTTVERSDKWGFDHGCWSVAKNLYPEADVPIIQLSLDYTKDARYHYDLAKELAALRTKGVLILGSGNMVHNLGMMQLKGTDINEPFGLDWALEARAKFKELIDKQDHTSLINYNTLGKSVQLSVPTPEHYLPLLYVLALQDNNDELSYFNDEAIAGSLTMTSVSLKPKPKKQ